jgi:DnaJ-like protein
MPPLRTTLDPEGYYARLGVEPSVGTETITAAYRRQARLLHPDVPGTGDAGAFVALKQAYDVLVNAGRRAAYDRLALLEAERRQRSRHAPPRRDAASEREPGEIGPVPFPEMRTPPTRHPRPRDLPVAVWVGMAAVVLVGAVEIARHLIPASPRARQETIPATATEVPPRGPNDPPRSIFGPAPVRLAGTPNFYIVPAASPSILWREDDARHTLVPWETLPPFSAVQGLRLFKSNGMVEVKVTDSANGFIEAGRLTPGDAVAANRAWCTYNAGPTPANGEILSQAPLPPDVTGRAKLLIQNQSGQPAVVKIRTADGAVSVFLAPGGQTALEGLPPDPVRLEYAIGEVWSRACHGFSAGMRAQRLADPVVIGAVTRLTIPPDPSLGPVDLPDQAFEQE